MTTTAVILAAGRGDRMEAGVNKILLPIGGQPLIHWTIRSFARIPEITDVILVAHASEMETIRKLVAPVVPRGLRIVPGGANRRDSAIAGIRASHTDTVLIHDGARPFPTGSLIRNVIVATREHKAVIPVLPITDMLHHWNPEEKAIASLRSSDVHLSRAQTPQGFSRDLILRCLEVAPSEIRDDASALLLAGHVVATVPGERTNLKITRPEDLSLAEAIAASLGT